MWILSVFWPWQDFGRWFFWTCLTWNECGRAEFWTRMQGFAVSDLYLQLPVRRTLSAAWAEKWRFSVGRNSEESWKGLLVCKWKQPEFCPVSFWFWGSFKVNIGSEESANENVLLTSDHRQASSHVELDDYFKLCGSWTSTVWGREGVEKSYTWTRAGWEIWVGFFINIISGQCPCVDTLKRFPSSWIFFFLLCCFFSATAKLLGYRARGELRPLIKIMGDKNFHAGPL